MKLLLMGANEEKEEGRDIYSEYIFVLLMTKKEAATTKIKTKPHTD